MPNLSIHQTRSIVLPIAIDITEQELRQLAEANAEEDSAGTDILAKTEATAKAIRYSYYRLMLRTPCLLLSTRKLLARYGVDWLEEGGQYEAYGILPEGAITAEVLCALENVVGIEPGEPPCSK